MQNLAVCHSKAVLFFEVSSKLAQSLEEWQLFKHQTRFNFCAFPEGHFKLSRLHMCGHIEVKFKNSESLVSKPSYLSDAFPIQNISQGLQTLALSYNFSSLSCTPSTMLLSLWLLPFLHGMSSLLFSCYICGLPTSCIHYRSFQFIFECVQLILCS